MKSKNLTFKYSAQQLLYWAAVCCIISFAASYLLANGFNASETGRILFTANFISFVLQPVVAGKADRAEKNIISLLLLILSGITAVCFLAVRFIPMPKLVFSFLYIVGMASLDMEVPLLNSENVYYSDRGWNINYGLARAAGSASYSLMSLGLGYVIELFGAGWVPVISIGLMLALLAFVAVMPKDESDSSRQKLNDETCSLPAFFIKYKWYCLSLSGVLLLAMFHVMVENYLIEILRRLGGNSSGVGIALFIATVVEAPMLVVFAKIHRKIGSYKALLIAGISYCLKAVLFILARSVPMIYAAQILQVSSYSFLSPVQMYYAGECTSEADMVKGQSVITAAYALGCALGNLLGGELIASFGVPVMLYAAFVITLLGTASLIITVPKAFPEPA